MIDKHKSELNKCHKDFQTIEKNTCFVKSNLDHISIRERNYNGGIDEYLVLTTPNSDLELTLNARHLDKGLNYLNVTRIKSHFSNSETYLETNVGRF